MTEMTGHIDVQRLYAELSDILSEKFGVKVTFKQRDCEDITRYYFVGTSVTKEEMPVVTPKDGYLVKWEVTAEEKLTNLQGDVVIEAIEQSLTWSPVA
jgi:hypothetical protein